MNRKATTAIAASACAAVVGAAVGIYATDLIYRTAAARVQPLLTREKEPNRDKLDLLSRRRLELMDELEQWEGEVVEITSRDGLKLKAHWFETPNAKRIVIMVHGWRSTWSRDFGMCAGWFRSQGCNLLLIEQRSHGLSQGNYIGFGVLERFDCLKWLDYVCTRWGEQLPIYLYGISMGCATVLMASGFGLPNCVKGIIADCGFTSPEDIFRHIVRDKTRCDFLLLPRVAGRISRLRAGYSLSEYSTLDAMKVNKTPILFIHGSADTFVPMEMTMKNFHACRADKQILIVDGAPHARSYLVAPTEYHNSVIGFFNRYDNRRTKA